MIYLLVYWKKKIYWEKMKALKGRNMLTMGEALRNFRQSKIRIFHKSLPCRQTGLFVYCKSSL